MDTSKKSICTKIIKPVVTGNQNWDRVTVVMNNFYSDPKYLKLNEKNRRKALQYTELIKGTKDQRDLRAKELLAKGDSTQKGVAVEKLINEQNAEALADNWKQGDGFVRAAVRRAGLEVHDDEHGAHFEPYTPERKAPLWWRILFIAAAFLLAVAYLYHYRKQGVNS